MKCLANKPKNHDFFCLLQRWLVLQVQAQTCSRRHFLAFWLRHCCNVSSQQVTWNLKIYVPWKWSKTQYCSRIQDFEAEFPYSLEKNYTCFSSYPYLIVSNCIYHVQTNLKKICLNQSPDLSLKFNEPAINFKIRRIFVKMASSISL